MLIIYGGLAFLFFAYYYSGSKRTYCFWVFLYFFICSAVKSLSNSDLRVYKDIYELNLRRSLNDLVVLVENEELKDIGYHALARIWGGLGGSFLGWTWIVAAIFAASITFLIYKYSNSPFFSLLVILTFYFLFTMSGLRQTIALSFILLAQYYIIEKKPFHFIVMVFLATIFHVTAICFLPAYYIARMKINWKQWVFIIVSLGITVLTPSSVKNWISVLLEDQYYEAYAYVNRSLTWSGYIIQFLFVAVCFFVRKSDDYEGNKSTHLKCENAFLNLMVVGLCLRGFSTVIAELFRLSYYYAITSMIVLPNTFAKQRLVSNRRILFLGIGLSMIGYMIWSREYFDFMYYWQG